MSEYRDEPGALLRRPGSCGWSEATADQVVVHFCGELDLSTGTDVQALLTDAGSSLATTILVDLSDVSFIDAHTVGLIVNAWKAATHRRQLLRVVGLRGMAARLFGLLELERLLIDPLWRDEHMGGAGSGPGGRDGAGIGCAFADGTNEAL